ncbi:MAG: hypothetical protein NVS2B7_31550 [Herpetosiphon sp.]
MHRRTLSLLTLVVALVLSIPTLASPNAALQCFTNVPGIASCIDGRFNDYWNNNGGLSVFGYPLDNRHPEVNKDDGQSHETQWFERNRFERHSEKPAPYDVLLGRLGDELLIRQGRNWKNEPNQGNPLGGQCQHFDQTNRDVCGPFLDFWRAYGLHDATLDAYNQSLQLFGLPLTGVKMETNPNGDAVLTQWFERARFEWHPEKPVPYKLLLGLLGREARAVLTVPPEPSDVPPPPPVPTVPRATPVPTPAPPAAGIRITRAPGVVSPGQSAAVAITTSANRQCAIEVDYKSGPSRAAGLYPKTTDTNGNADWSWKVGTRTTPGDWPVIITCDSDQARTVVSVR